MQVITDACVKIGVLKICSENNTREFVVKTIKSKCTVAVFCWYIKDDFAGFCQQTVFYLMKIFLLNDQNL